MSKYFMKNNEKSASHPRLRKMQADSSHQQVEQQQ